MTPKQRRLFLNSRKIIEMGDHPNKNEMDPIPREEWSFDCCAFLGKATAKTPWLTHISHIIRNPTLQWAVAFTWLMRDFKSRNEEGVHQWPSRGAVPLVVIFTLLLKIVQNAKSSREGRSRMWRSDSSHLRMITQLWHQEKWYSLLPNNWLKI